ncbi:MAG: SipW-dependent-type signal peptide-containing protein [Nitriliruptorales bacterium]|nr:SipW-dependent-type signal peptide-containing protein [Nitriliruptorales bacterium]
MKALTKPANVRLIAAVASLILVSALIVRTTQAAFSDVETNTGNSFAAGTVDLQNSFSAPLFAPGGVAPTVDTAAMNGGESRINCIDVTYTGTLGTASDVTLQATKSAAGALDSYLSLDVELHAGAGCVDGGAATVYSGPLDGFVAAVATATGWAPAAGSETVSFRFVGTLADDDAAQGLTSGTVDFTWTAQS